MTIATRRLKTSQTSSVDAAGARQRQNGSHFRYVDSGLRLSPRDWLIGIGFVPAYIAVNYFTSRYAYHNLGITLWSPDDGMSVILLAANRGFLPFAALSGVLSDMLVNNVRYGLGVSIAVQTVLAICYAWLGASLRNRLIRDLRDIRLRQVLEFVGMTLAGVTIVSLILCPILYLTNALEAPELWLATRNFWIGDLLGILVLAPTSSAIRAFFSPHRYKWRYGDSWTVLGFVAALAGGLAALAGADGTAKYPLFYPLFLPIIWVAIRAGYGATAIALLMTQTALFLMASYGGYDIAELYDFQVLMLVLSITALLLGAVVTERSSQSRLLQEQQSELARMSAYASAGAMGMALAHEISQPVTSVVNYLHAARRMLFSAGGSTADDALIKAEIEAHRVGEILGRIRDLVSTGLLDLQMLDLFELSRSIRDLCQDHARAQGVSIFVHGPPGVPAVKADRVAILQVLNNLVINAVDAASCRAHSDGVVTIRVLSANATHVTVSVEDNGPGVAAEMTEKLFEPYQTSKPRGMGLGLSLSRRIVEAHSGALRWEPMATCGARFAFDLPIDGPFQHGL
jgi:two-component system, LuxR family, sensor kinase FixL